ncbi:uncharacterized protein DUF2812 [Paenibacillus cellulosilyticus]|uniref:Uncharacterized protein DUF2812 n=1 Tax=Paenibacillus cellulosilyticus TaxID=375489 RepID=A0A2V2YS81_9BACL|nr:DUF2812 domain-containing protein [Paenibacillus cellulosilyticus]PWW00920.1 uncharacterized protein DUF2812 [Paenibacillus cellulosilyticus]QKS47575.1 DUF2812 domain-containing protein [Paenibacillus cellulosilyticus]
MTHVDQFVARTRVSFVWNYERDEEWLTSLSAQGQHLVKPGTFRYRFEQDASVRYVYRLDYHQIKEKGQLDAYYALFEDMGWEHVGSNMGWHYFRKPCVEGETSTPIYTDRSSLIQLLKRVQLMLIVLAFANVPIMFVNIFNVWNWNDRSQTISGVITSVVVLQVLVVILLSYGSVCFQRKIRRLAGH